jgi:hypothetical protein
VLIPRFFFDTSDGERSFPDKEGMELESIEAAKSEGQKALPDMVKDTLPSGNFRSFVVSVRDEGGQVVLRMALSLVVEEDRADT